MLHCRIDQYQKSQLLSANKPSQLFASEHKMAPRSATSRRRWTQLFPCIYILFYFCFISHIKTFDNTSHIVLTAKQLQPDQQQLPTPNTLTQWHQKHFKLALHFHSFPWQTLQNCVTGSADEGIEAKAWEEVKAVQLTNCPPQKSKEKKKKFSADIAYGQLTHLEKHWRMETVSIYFCSRWAWFFFICGLLNVTHHSQVLIQTDILASFPP